MIRRVEREGGARFQVYGRRGGRKVYVGSYDSRREAAEAEEDFKVTQRKIERGELPPNLDVNRTVAVATAEWLTSLEKRGSRSRRPYGSFMRCVLPTLGATKLGELDRGKVMAWRDSAATRWAATTVNVALGVFSVACSDFVDRGWMAVNPCRGVKRLRTGERAYLWIRTRGEIERLIGGVAEPDLRDALVLALSTGLRIGELLALRWDDVDLRARRLTVQRGGQQGMTKSGRVRHVPILDTALGTLQARALRRAGAELVLPASTASVIDRRFKTELRRAGLDTAIRWHDLRHTFASHWVMGGGDIFLLAKILGHSSVAITQKVYAHLAPDAWAAHYHRVAFAVPTEAAPVLELRARSA